MSRICVNTSLCPVFMSRRLFHYYDFSNTERFKSLLSKDSVSLVFTCASCLLLKNLRHLPLSFWCVQRTEIIKVCRRQEVKG